MDRPRSLLAFDSAPSHNGKRNVVYLDTSVETLDEAKFQELFETQRKLSERKDSGNK